MTVDCILCGEESASCGNCASPSGSSTERTLVQLNLVRVRLIAALATNYRLTVSPYREPSWIDGRGDGIKLALDILQNVVRSCENDHWNAALAGAE